ncbi:hypothetical protein [Phyllobacterium leguminum]|uniref:Transmembrane protein n=1 Tax=Phyllobacterium leguminum TaxID=314237 RepID=A0A318T4F7_9HYPH|nr:hypothetical protein [Phyllobacterium leguminum]PYE88981.1 hypothetical protein C7477_10580 [Phyllobacterium leguminum]
MGFDDHSFKKDYSDYSSGSMAEARSGALRVALLFGSAAIALAMILVPILNNRSKDVVTQSLFPNGVDTMATGSIRNSQAYTVRRSVLQPTPQAVCIVHTDGTRNGEC